jgi:aminopeptidase YwaD
MMMGWRAAAAAIVLMSASAQAQTAAWVVKPEWVKAHEDFLASDAMRGRGSATHDEQVTAEYVASEFEGYGLTYAPGMKGYIQTAELAAPALDGHAVLKVGGLTLVEGKDFTLLMSSGKSEGGPWAVADAGAGEVKAEKGSAVLLTGVKSDGSPFAVMGPLMRSGVALVVMEDGPGVERMHTMVGGKTRVSVRLKDAPARRALPTVVTVSHAVMERLKAVKAGETASLEVHEVEAVGPRMTYNAIGYLPGTDAKAGTILLTAHLDHLGVGDPVDGDSIWNGANDDAAGTTAVLELAHALAAGPRLKRSVLFVCYGSEELGELGSTYFGEHPPVPLTDLVANLEFEMIGNQDPKMPQGVLLLTGWGRSNLGPTLAAHGALLGDDPYPEEHFFERSDNYALALKGVVAHTAAGWGDPPTYHHPNDDMAHLNLPFMTAAIQSLVGPVEWLADSDFKPSWNKDGQPVRQ